MPGIELEDVMAGISVCRNQYLANVFYRLHLIEAYGTGIGKIMRAYKGSLVVPEVIVTKNTFKIILPNINYKNEVVSSEMNDVGKNQKIYEKMEVTEEEKNILRYVESHDGVKKKDVMELLGVSESTATRLIKKLVANKLLVQNGKARNTFYSLGKQALA